ncbi:hypothetical protein CEXT_551871 [Caerostris extrusa]|uniref:Uncharacterized protein n=1 Tax=Caerostris extrusa TaxID=172846 RepID=A0AAV4MB48_CAEEX|nr:hypothetical protein CEXT_551871 [Caerostris extrusa]
MDNERPWLHTSSSLAQQPMVGQGLCSILRQWPPSKNRPLRELGGPDQEADQDLQEEEPGGHGVSEERGSIVHFRVPMAIQDPKVELQHRQRYQNFRQSAQ